MTKEKTTGYAGISASEWARKNLGNTTLSLSEESAKLFTALSVGGFGASKIQANSNNNIYIYA